MGRGENSSINVDNVDKWTIDFKLLAYNICGIYTTNIQPIAYMVFNIVHLVRKPDLLRVCNTLRKIYLWTGCGLIVD